MLDSILFEHGLIEALPDLVGKNFAIVVCDTNTKLLLGTTIFSKLLINSDIYVLPSYVKATQDIVNTIVKIINHELIVAVGSGTIADICKRVAYLTKIGYFLFPTAASVNAYTSENSSLILSNGKKTSLEGCIPQRIYVDLKIIVNSPTKLTNSGFADLICRATVEPDCLLSHLLFNTYYDANFFSEIKEYEDELLQNHQHLYNSQSLIKILMEGLLKSGLGMKNAKSSIVASQGEHQIAHIVEKKLNNDTGNSPLHGEMVALSSLHMINVQNYILQHKLLIKKYKHISKKEITCFYGEDLSEEYYRIYLKKISLLEGIGWHNKWPDIKDCVLEKRANYTTYYNAFSWLKLPTYCTDINLNFSTYDRICKTAFFTRERFTFLDLNYYIGI